MTRYDGLEYGRKIREFNSKEEANKWKENCKGIGKIGKYKGKRICQIRKSR